MRIRLIGLAIGALLLTGCATAAGPPATQAPSPATEVTPQRGGVFQMIGIRPLLHLHPWTQATGANANFYLVGSIYDALMDYDHKPGEDWRGTKVVGSLADGWEQPDPVTYLFRIRKGVKWHDGQPPHRPGRGVELSVHWRPRQQDPGHHRPPAGHGVHRCRRRLHRQAETA